MDSRDPVRTSTHRVGEDQVGLRLDRFLSENLAFLSRTRIQELIRDGGVQVAGETVLRPSHPMELDQAIEVRHVDRSCIRRGSEEGLALTVLHEDAGLIVIEKPAGMVAHPSTTVRGGTVAEHAAERFGDLPSLQGEERPGIVHRLDAETSGVMVLARTEAVATSLIEQFRERTVKKTYLALVEGEPRFDTEWIRVAVGRHPQRPDRISVKPEKGGGIIIKGEGDDIPPEDQREGTWLEASTFYEVSERFRRHALLSCSPRTGRTHQIRVHLAHIGLPVIGDRLYRKFGASRPRLPKGAPPVERQLLHAHRLEFEHPLDGRRVTFESPVPADFRAALEWLRDAT